MFELNYSSLPHFTLQNVHYVRIWWLWKIITFVENIFLPLSLSILFIYYYCIIKIIFMSHPFLPQHYISFIKMITLLFHYNFDCYCRITFFISRCVYVHKSILIKKLLLLFGYWMDYQIIIIMQIKQYPSSLWVLTDHYRHDCREGSIINIIIIKSVAVDTVYDRIKKLSISKI